MTTSPISIKKELLAACSTFATMCYIIVVIPTMLSDAGMDFSAAMVATILTTFFATLFMGLIAKAPFAVAPGLGTAAYIVYSVVIGQHISWQQALAIVFLAALLLLLFTLFGIRRKLVRSIPPLLIQAIIAGVGLFLIFVGLKELGMIQKIGTFVTLGSIYNIELLFALGSLILILVLLHFGWKSAFIIAILCNWILALILGYTHWQGWISWPPSLSPTFLQLDFSILLKTSLYKPLLTIFLITLFDSTCALITLSKKAKRMKGDEIIGLNKALLPDATFTLLGAILGTSSLAIHLESASGIQAGGRSGLVSIFVAFGFLLLLFFYPLVSSIPHFATAPVLIVIGAMMASHLKEIDWQEKADGVLALITALIMPLTMSLYNGFVFGFTAYTVLRICTGRIKEVPLLCWILTPLFLIQLFFL